MDVSDYLALVGELGIGVAGFAGIVAALSRRAAGDWRPVDILRLQVLLRSSVGCALWAVLPAFLLTCGVSGDPLWRISSGLWLPYIAFAANGTVRRIREVYAEPERRADASLPLIALVGSGVLVTASLQAANAAFLGQAWPHLLALAWGLGISAVLFLRLAMVAFRSESDA